MQQIKRRVSNVKTNDNSRFNVSNKLNFSQYIKKVNKMAEEGKKEEQETKKIVHVYPLVRVSHS